MSPFLGILFAVVVIGLIIVGAIAANRAKKARLAALAQFARQHGWQFHPDNNPNHDDQYPQFSIFSQGDSRYAYNTLTGSIKIDQESWPAQMGDYHYCTTSGTGKDRKTHDYYFSYLLLKLPYRQLPSLTVRPEGLFDRLASFVGFDDIDFESNEFSNRYHVKGSDKKFVYDVIHPRMMEFLMATDPLPIDIEDCVCCISDGKKCWEPNEFLLRAAWADEFFARWPQHVTSTLER